MAIMTSQRMVNAFHRRRSKVTTMSAASTMGAAALLLVALLWLAGAFAPRDDRSASLAALADRIAADEAMLGLAEKEYYPDFEPYFMVDRFMGNMSGNRDLSTMLGVRMNLPVYRSRRNAAVTEAEAKITQRRAELAKLTDQVNLEVEEAYARVLRSQRSTRLYRDTILKAAQSNIKAAQSAYVTGKIPFLTLIEAQRNLVTLRDRYQEAIAQYFQRRATLERVVGGPLPHAE